MPHGAPAEIVVQRAEQLTGKVVVDITNPVNFETFDSLVVPADRSAAAELATSLLAGIVTATGLRAIDVGSLRRARELEALRFLPISLAAAEKIPWTAGFAVIS